jgi:hypothetical protein
MRNPAKTLRPRKCKYCRAVFTPARPQDKDAKFCKPNHRKAFWRYGALPFDKIMSRVETLIRRMIREMVRPEMLRENPPSTRPRAP